jgi:hypothetical protein
VSEIHSGVAREESGIGLRGKEGCGSGVRGSMSPGHMGARLEEPLCAEEWAP